MEAQAKAKEEGKGWFRQRLAQGTPSPPLRIDLPSDFKVNELASFLGTDEHYVTDLIPPEYIKASNDLTALAPKWSDRGHLLAALPKHLADSQEAIKSQQNIDKEMTDLSLIASAWLKSQQQKELLEARLKRFKETAGYPSMASILDSPVLVGSTNKEQAMSNLDKAAEFGAMMGKIAGGVVDLGKGSYLYSDKERYEPGSNARFSLTWGEEHMKDFEDAIMDHVKQLNREDALRIPRNPKYDIQEKDLEDYDKFINWLPTSAQAPHREKLNLLKTPSRADMGKIAASSDRPGLWANIRAKKERGEAAAKPGDKDYPDGKNWKKVTAISEKKAETPAWQRSEGKNPDGGLNNKGRASLKAEGKNIKRPQPEGGARRDSFCARMGGMKAKLTSEATANDPDSRINKALRKWNC
jgi:hypothetical protein